MSSARLFSFHPPTAFRDEIEVHARLLVDLVSAGSLEVEQPREEIPSGVERHHASHDRADLWIEEGRDQLFD